MDLSALWCEENQLSELNVNSNSNLSALDCYSNKLTALNVSNNPKLYVLRCGGNHLQKLDVSNNPLLQLLECSGNQLTELNVRNHPVLETLGCHDNQLAELYVSNNTKLQSLNCGWNKLQVLNVRNNPVLKWFRCGYNQLIELDISNNTKLTELVCYGNHLTKLDARNNPDMEEFWGDGQSVAISLTGRENLYASNIIFGNGTNFDNSALSYSNGLLTSTSNAAISSYFTSPIDRLDMNLSGVLSLVYGESSGIVETVKGNEAIVVYPNPVQDELRITNYELRDGEAIRILDLSGRTVMTAKRNTIRVSSLPAGVYFVKAGNQTAKLIKQ
jgi:hypothetical protein